MDANHWDERYETAEFVWKTEPNQFLPAEVDGLDAGRALDLGCGEGRNAVWLAGQGWSVIGVDFSQVGLDKGARLADKSGVDVDWVCADATAWTPDSSFDLVIVFYLQLAQDARRAAFTGAARALAPGGTLLIVGHAGVNLVDGVGGPQDPSVLYDPDDVRADLASAGVGDLVVDRAEHVRRSVDTPAGPRFAVDCLVRVHRPIKETP